MKQFIKDLLFIVLFFPTWIIAILSLPDDLGWPGEIIGLLFFLSLAAVFVALTRVILRLVSTIKKRAKL